MIEGESKVRRIMIPLLIVLLLTGCIPSELNDTDPNELDVTSSEPNSQEHNPVATTPIETNSQERNPVTTTPIETNSQGHKTEDTMPPETGNIEPNTPLAAYRAYYELIESKIEEYGVGYNDGGFYEGEFESYWRGVYRGIIHAELIDFNNDGLPELVIIYNNGIGLGADLWSIYGYTESIEKYYEAYSGGDGGSSYDISIAVSSDGIRYLDCYEGYVVYDYEIFEHYYTVRDGAWVTALSRSFVFCKMEFPRIVNKIPHYCK